MRIWFKMPEPNDLIDLCITIATCEGCNPLDVPCHVATEFSDGRQFSAQYQEGARWKDEITVGKWTSITIPRGCIPFRETDAIVWCDSIVGKPYDYLGAAASATRLQTRMADHYFCSQTAIAILSRCGLFGIPETLNPYALRQYLARLLNGEHPKLLARCPEFHYREQ